MQDSYLPPFQACVVKGKVTGIMCSHNAINGIPACGNEWLLQKVARDAWNRSDAIIQSDCGAVSNIYHQHHAVQVTLLSA